MLVERDQDLRVDGRTVDFPVLQPARPVRWLKAWEDVHACLPRPLPFVADFVTIVGTLLLTTHSPAGAVAAASAFLLTGWLTGLYRHRSTIEAQGVLWYVRSLVIPAAVMGIALREVGNRHHLSLFAPILSAAALVLVLRVAGWAVVAGARRRQLGLRDALAVGPTTGVQKLSRRMSAFPEAGLRLAAAYSPGSTSNGEADAGRQRARHLLQSGQVRHVLLISDSYDEAVLDECVRWSEGQSVDYSLVLPIATLAGTTAIRIGDLGIVPLGCIDLGRPRMFGKRGFDIMVSGLLLLLLAPVLALVAAAVWLHDRGPVFYRQPRIGLDNRAFTMWKFRSMVPGADRLNGDHAHANIGSGLLFKLRDDPRITPIGALIRRLSVDELPQLFNVLRGDMSLVGPRPLPVEPDAFDALAKERHRARPGITGSWQVAGANALGYDDMVKLDLAYIATWSFQRDLWLLLRTIPAVLVRRSPC